MASDERSYGVHGDFDLAELVRARGWLSAPPAASVLSDLVAAAHFELHGVVNQTPPEVTHIPPDHMVLRFGRFTFPTTVDPWVAVFGTEGDVEIVSFEQFWGVE